MKYYIVDAFTDYKFGGNPAAIVIVNPKEQFPDDDIMLKVAAEFRYSETVYVQKTGDHDFIFRYFTPEAEVDLCGHGTIGAFQVLREMGQVKTGDYCNITTPAGVLGIQVEEKSVLMEMGPPHIVDVIDNNYAIEALYTVAGIVREDIDILPKTVSTGLVDIMLPVKDEEQLAQVKPDFTKLRALSETYGAVGLHAFTISSKDGLVHCRNFAPLYGIDEEAATGTANGALTFYLYNEGLITPGETNTFIQGEAMDRPSKVLTRIDKIKRTEESTQDFRVKVGGMGVVLAEGDIRI